MREILDEMDPLFAAAAVAIAGLSLMSRMPNPPLVLEHPPLDIPATVQPAQ